MPELKHHFRAGKMNKDLDERLVPNGEYRDAQNIEISTSEGDDVGTIQNVVGTTQVLGKTYDSNTEAITASWSNASFGLTNAVCIGSKLNNENDKIYWFITSDESDCIAEYDDIKGIISPVLVDANDILNWKTTDYITGINVVEGMLLWTDNKTEPKKIDIDVFKSGCSGNFTTHSKYSGKKIHSADLSSAAVFTEQHITVAKKAPITAPTLTMATSTRGGNGTGINPVLISNSTAGLFADSEGNGLAAGTVVSLNFTPQSVFEVGDIIILTSTYEELSSAINYEIKVRLTAVTNSGSNATAVIQSIPVFVEYQALVWEALLSEEGVLFEKKFVRFGYRWKYTSGEYSTFSPFGELAFKPTTFEYLSSDGYNVGMINNLRDLTINITDTTPIDVDEVDILYKESNNNLIYVVDTLKEDEDGNIATSYKLESEIIGKVVESNQMLRPWDNVPRKALAQEVTANRLIYANYLQNYNVPSFNSPDISMTISQAPITTVKEPELSIKSLRTYQAGVVYIDAYNRQTPVFTSNGASKQTSKTYAETVNDIQLTLNNTPPDWATHFKYYIKETSNEYYNLAMDRYYLSEDGNVWLSFPSSERNKVKEDAYLILKKQHDSDVFVGTEARYKVLDIQNEAPDFIKLIKKSIGSVDGTTAVDNVPQIGSTSFKFRGPDPLDSPSFAQGFTADGLIQLVVGGAKTAKYDIISGGYSGEEDDSGLTHKHIYSVSISEPLKEGETMLASLSAAANDSTAGSSLSVILYEEQFKRKPEFYGRFFVKINRDGDFDTNIIETYPDVQAEYGIVNSRTIYADSQNSGPGDGDQEASWYDTGQSSRHSSYYITSANNGHPKMGSKFMRIYWTGAPSGEPKKKHDKADTINSWLKSLSNAGTLFRMKGSSTNNTSEVYVVIGSTISYQYRRQGRRRLGSTKRREYKIEFEHALNLTPYEDSFTFGSDKIDEIQIVEKVIDGNNETITSDNPAVWETEPREAIDMDLYYETGNTRPIAQHGATHTIPFKNCYSFGNGVESDRLRDDFNAVKIDKGVKVSTVLAEQYKEERRKNGLIYSGLFNSTSGVNRLNQFIAGESITKDINPHYGSIQKIHARNTDLVTFCEDKVLKILANKDALYEASGNPQLTATNRVLGQAIPFVGEYGISTNPESFAQYAFRCYFADKNRGAILRLSRDGLTAISENGMRDYFKDGLPTSTLVLGSYDDSKGIYNLTLNNETVSFDEKVNGFPSFKSFIPEAAVSLNNKYYSFKNGNLWVHNNEKRNRFYDTSGGEDDATKYYESSVTVLINDIPETIKGFKTVNYSGSRSKIYTNDYDAGNSYANPTSTDSDGWYCNSITTDVQTGFIKEFKKKENRYYNYIKGDATTLTNLDSQEFNVQGIGNFTGSLAGDTALADKTVTVSLTGVNGATVDNYTFDVEVGTEIHTANSSITMTLTPSNGYTLTAGDLSVVEGSNTSMITEYVTSVTFAQTGTNVTATVNFTDGVNMPVGDLSIPLAVTGDGALNVYLLHDVALNYNTDSNVTVTKVWSGTSNATAENNVARTGLPGNYGVASQVATIEFNLDTNYDFKVAPSYKLDRDLANDPESEYTVTYQDYDVSASAITIGAGGKVLADVDKRIYTITYKFPARPTSDDIFTFDAISTPAEVTEDNKITGYNVSGLVNASRFESTKNISIYGAVGATFTFKRTIDGGTANYWDGDSFETGSTTLTMGATGVYIVPITFFEISTTTVYQFTIAAISPTTLLSPIMGNIYNTSGVVQNPFTVNQYADPTLTLTAAGTGVTVTSSNVTSTYTALGFPVESSGFFKIPLTITGTAAANITADREPETEDFTNYNSNDFDWDYEFTSTTIDNSGGTKTISIVGDVYVDQYGTASTTSSLQLDNFISLASGGSSSGQIMWTPAVTGSGGYTITSFGSYNDGTYSRTLSKLIDFGTASGTNITGTGVITGNFYGNAMSEITLSISADSAACVHTSTNLTVTKYTLLGSGATATLNYTWSAQFDELIDNASDATFTVAVALDNEP